MNPDSILVKLDLSNAFNSLTSRQYAGVSQRGDTRTSCLLPSRLRRADIPTIQQFHRTIAGRCTARRPFGALALLPSASVYPDTARITIDLRIFGRSHSGRTPRWGGGRHR